MMRGNGNPDTRLAETGRIGVRDLPASRFTCHQARRRTNHPGSDPGSSAFNGNAIQLGERLTNFGKFGDRTLN